MIFILAWTLDKTKSGDVPKNYRQYNAIISGSGQITRRQIAYLKNKMQNGWIVDLRKEIHLFVDEDTSINFLDATNNPLEVEKKAAYSFNRANVKGIPGYRVLFKNPITLNLVKTPYKIRYHMISTEGDSAQSYGLGYKRFTVTDHEHPAHQLVDDFIAWYRTLPPRTKIHFHCAGGKGRTNSFILMYQILNQRNNLTFEGHLAAIEVYSSVNLNPDTRIPRQKTSADRYTFLRQFYGFVCDPKGYNANVKFSEWIRK